MVFSFCNFKNGLNCKFHSFKLGKFWAFVGIKIKRKIIVLIYFLYLQIFAGDTGYENVHPEEEVYFWPN